MYSYTWYDDPVYILSCDQKLIDKQCRMIVTMKKKRSQSCCSRFVYRFAPDGRILEIYICFCVFYFSIFLNGIDTGADHLIESRVELSDRSKKNRKINIDIPRVIVRFFG